MLYAKTWVGLGRHLLVLHEESIGGSFAVAHLPVEFKLVAVNKMNMNNLSSDCFLFLSSLQTGIGASSSACLATLTPLGRADTEEKKTAARRTKTGNLIFRFLWSAGD